MIAGNAGIRLDAGADLRLRPGEAVLLTVVRHLSGDRWAVSLLGRELVAHSELALSPGEIIRARVGGTGDRFLLRRLNAAGQALRPPAGGVQPAQGLAAGGLSERIVSALMKAGIGLEPALMERMRRLLAGRDNADGRLIRLIALLFDKNLDPHSPGFARVLALLGEGGGGSRQGSRRERERRRPAPAAPEETPSAGAPEGPPARDGVVRLLKERIRQGPAGAGEGDPYSPLRFLNHLPAGHQDWIVIPYRLSGRGAALSGFLRILYDPHLKSARRLIVETRQDEGGQWAFVLTRNGERFFLTGFSSDRGVRRRGWDGLSDLRTKLQNIGVEVDDTIREYRDFDGFSLPEEGSRVRGVDTWR